MKFLPSLGALALAGLASTASAQTVSTKAVIGACWSNHLGLQNIAVNLDEAAGSSFFLLVSADEFKTLPWLLGPYALDASGNALITADVDVGGLMPSNKKISFKALFRDGKYVMTTNKADVILAPKGCTQFDFDVTPGGGTTVNGETITEQWASVGIHVSAQSQPPLAINKAIIFDSSIPSLADPDLITPGYGMNNTEPLGNLLIIAENQVDANNDGLIDSPDDAYNGGLMIFKFDETKAVCSATLVDIDEEVGSGTWKLRFYKDTNATQLITAITIPPLDDNDVQQLQFFVEGVKRMDVKMGGSGGLASFAVCPSCIDWDQDTVGKPLGLKTGEVITNQLKATYGFEVSAVNQTIGHPNKAILFNTAAPTGGDTDLAAPGYGPGNDHAQGKVLIIAEHDGDKNGDGLVDIPDDEATGGKIWIDFDFDATILSVEVMDVDTGGPTRIDCIDGSNLLMSSTPVPNLGDNSVQTILVNTPSVRRLKIVAGGSMAVSKICYCPTIN